MIVKVNVPIVRNGVDAQAELTKLENGEVEIYVPSVGTHRIARFSVKQSDLNEALNRL